MSVLNFNYEKGKFIVTGFTQSDDPVNISCTRSKFGLRWIQQIINGQSVFTVEIDEVQQKKPVTWANRYTFDVLPDGSNCTVLGHTCTSGLDVIEWIGKVLEQHKQYLSAKCKKINT